MNYLEILKKVDHTQLKQSATIQDIIDLCTDAKDYSVASVCVPPCYVKFVKDNFKELKICTVIGFPNGYSTTKTKVEETKNSIANGANEIDVVINLTDLKNKKYSNILNELKKIRRVCKNQILKVIVETCLLDDSEKIEICKIVEKSGADYIKTSTGFSCGGAKIEDVLLFKKTCPNLKVKASGGINNFEYAQSLIDAGANRLGTSRLINIYKNLR